MSIPAGSIVSSITLCTIEDAPLFQITASPAEFNINSDEKTAKQFSLSLSFSKKENASVDWAAYNCYWALFRYNGTGYVLQAGNASSSKVSQASVSPIMVSSNPSDTNYAGHFIVRIGSTPITGTTDDYEWEYTVQVGKFGDTGATRFPSMCFIRVNRDSIAKPSGGTYARPIPTSEVYDPETQTYLQWSDGIPAGEAKIWATTCEFSSDDPTPDDPQWSVPREMSDTDTFDVEFAPMQTNDATPDAPTADNRHKEAYPYGYNDQVWFDPTLDKYSASGVVRDFTQMYWRAERECKNGKWGDWTIVRMKGEKGDTGAKGDTPINCYRWYPVGTTPNISNLPQSEQPAQSDSTARPTTGWVKNAPNRPTDTGDWNLWMINSVKHADNSVDTWQGPVRISGDNGTAGEDGSDTEWIFKYDTDGYKGNWGQVNPSGAADSSDSNKQQNGWVPSGWFNHAQAISANSPTLYASWRTKPAGINSSWGAFQTPITWSHWGRNGMDGDGLEYVFIRTKTETAPTILSDNTYVDSNGHNYTNDEHLPRVNGNSNIENNENKYECSDDPKGTTDTWKFEWVIFRTKASANADGVRAWNYYVGSMTIWDRYVKDGDNAITYRIQPSRNSFPMPSDAIETTTTLSASFYKREVGGAEEAFSCYWALFRRKGAGYTRVASGGPATSMSSQSLSASISDTESFVICIFASSSTTRSGFLSELEIPMIEMGGKGDPGDDGENAVYVDLDNEHEDFLYGDAGLIAPSGGAQSQARLYDGGTEKTAQATWSISTDGTTWGQSVSSGATAGIATSGNNIGLLTVTALTASFIAIKVRAEYPSGKYHYATFTANRTSGDKYDLNFKPSSLPYNSAINTTNRNINIEVKRTTLSGSEWLEFGSATSKSKISNATGSGFLRLFVTYVKTSGSSAVTEQVTSSAFTATPTYCSLNNDFYFELRKYATYNASSSDTYEVCDYENVPIVKAENGSQGKMGRNYYYAGDWDAFTGSFTVTDYITPYFSIENGSKTEFYVYVGANGTFTKHDVGTPDRYNSNFAFMDTQFKYLITEAIFSNFAKLGSAIFNLDFMFSQYGQLIWNNQVVGDSSDYTKIDPTDMYGYDTHLLKEVENKSITNTSYDSAECIDLTEASATTGHFRIEFDTTIESSCTLYLYIAAGKDADKALPIKVISQGTNKINSYDFQGNGSHLYLFYRKSNSTKSCVINKLRLASLKFRPNVFVDWLKGAGFLRNLTVEAIINNMIMDINGDNCSDYGFLTDMVQSGVTYSVFYLNPLKCGSFLRFKLKNTSRLFFPSYCVLEAPYAEVFGYKEENVLFKVDEIRQMVGKKIYIMEGNDYKLNICSGQFPVSGVQSEIRMLMSKEVQYYELSINTPVGSPAYINAETLISSDMEQAFANDSAHVVRRDILDPMVCLSHSQGYKFYVLECKVGNYNGYDCVYWEVDGGPSPARQRPD